VPTSTAFDDPGSALASLVAELCGDLRAVSEKAERLGAAIDEWAPITPHTSGTAATTGGFDVVARLLAAAPGDRERLIAELRSLSEHVAREVRLIDFARRPELHRSMRATVMQFLDKNDLVEFDRQASVAERVVEALVRHAARSDHP
jgi:hypothetical protein